MQRQEVIDSVRYSHAGHDYHFTWAALRCLELLSPTSELKAVTIEGPSPAHFAKAGIQLRLEDGMPDVLLWNPQTDRLWVIEAVNHRA